MDMNQQETNSELSTKALYSMRPGLVLDEKRQAAYVRKAMSRQSIFAHYNFAPPEGWQQETYSVQGVKVEHFINPQSSSQTVLLEFHGGGYVHGLTDKHRLFTAKMGKVIDAKEIFLAHYRLTPKYIYPAALDDAVIVYQDLLMRGIQPQQLIVYGDSAGGNLTVELALYLKQHQLPLPCGLVLASPWANFRSDSPSWKKNENKDLVMGKGTLFYTETKNTVYAGKLSFDDPRLSPVQADLSGLPPMLIQVGGDELFLDDDIRLARKAAADGTPATLSIYPKMSHDFAIVAPKLEESRQSLLEVEYFVQRLVDC